MKKSITAQAAGFMLAFFVVIGGCGKSDNKSGATSLEAHKQRNNRVKTITGAGATFPYPVYAQWAFRYHNLTGIKINYQAIGSGGGIRQIKSGIVDFGASDAPLTKEELDAAGLVQFPMIIGGVVIVVNIPGVAAGDLKLTPELLADIMRGRIKKWNDSRIKKINPAVNLPDLDITVVHRADGSGTTWIFTDYLSKVSPEWKTTIGRGKAVRWPAGIGGKGNEGVSAYVKRINGAIGYVEFAYALQNNMAYVLLKNRAGNYVKPAIETFQAAAANADWEHAPGFYLVLTNQPGKNTWPITGASFILMHKEQPDAAKARAILDFFHWCYRHGKNDAVKLHYVPLPDKVITAVERMWASEIKSHGKRVWEGK